MRKPGKANAAFTLPEYCVQIENDPATTYTYVTNRTIPGTNNGLFTSIELKGSDETKALVGEYTCRIKSTSSSVWIPGIALTRIETSQNIP